MSLPAVILMFLIRNGDDKFTTTKSWGGFYRLGYCRTCPELRFWMLTLMPRGLVSGSSHTGGWYLPPDYIGSITSHHKDPYELTSIIYECHRGFEHCWGGVIFFCANFKDCPGFKDAPRPQLGWFWSDRESCDLCGRDFQDQMSKRPRFAASWANIFGFTSSCQSP